MTEEFQRKELRKARQHLHSIYRYQTVACILLGRLETRNNTDGRKRKQYLFQHEHHCSHVGAVCCHGTGLPW
ncbi:hypothetical protein LSAT2_010264 [Lamellibrachia satsuma]|nr:hypothetical protein LSAT2_010264 [Lamellibrachia satsuma]